MSSKQMSIPKPKPGDVLYEALYYDGSFPIMPAYFLFDDGVLPVNSNDNPDFAKALLGRLRKAFSLTDDEAPDYKLVENIYLNIDQKLMRLKDFDVPCFWV